MNTNAGKYFSINQDGYSIRCKLYAPDIKRVASVVVFGHGFSGDKDNRMAEKLAQRIQKRHSDAALLIFDWPCHGGDACNKLRLADCSAYLSHVIGYAKSRFRTDVLYGSATSFGGYLFLKYIAENGNPFRKVAFRCPAVNMYDVLTKTIMTEKDRHDIDKGKPLLIGFDRKVKVTKEFLEDLQQHDITHLDYSADAGDMLIVHGTKDEIVSYDAVKTFAGDNGISLHTAEGADHRFTDPQKMDEAITAIITALFG